LGKEKARRMTREEAIKEIIRAYDVLDFSSHMDNRRKEAFNMAKVALEQESVLDKIRAEIESKYNNCDICEFFEDYDYEENDISEYRPIGDIADILEIIDKHKAETENT
jgi:hypothetical protein